MVSMIKRFLADATGATAIEYGLIAALVSVGAVVALTELGSSLSAMLNVVAVTMDGALPTP